MPDRLDHLREGLHGIWLEVTAAGDALGAALVEILPDGLPGTPSGRPLVPVDLVTAFVLLLLVLHVLLIGQLVVLRWRTRRAEQRMEFAHQLWNRLLLDYLSGNATAPQVGAAVRRNERVAWGNFLRPFLADIEGEDHERLLHLLGALQYDAFLFRSLHAKLATHRLFAVQMLGLLRLPGAEPHVRPLLLDRSEVVRFAAAETLAQVKDVEALPTILRLVGRDYRDQQDRVVAMVNRYGVEACPTLLRLVAAGDSEPWLLVLAVNALGQFGYLTATWEILQVATTTSDRDLRLAAIRALVAFEDPTLIGFFESLLGDEDLVVRSLGAKAIGILGDASHVPVLTAQLHADHYWLLREAVDALLALGPEGRAAVEAARLDPALAPGGTTVIDEALARAAGA